MCFGGGAGAVLPCSGEGAKAPLRTKVPLEKDIRTSNAAGDRCVCADAIRAVSDAWL